MRSKKIWILNAYSLLILLILFICLFIWCFIICSTHESEHASKEPSYMLIIINNTWGSLFNTIAAFFFSLSLHHSICINNMHFSEMNACIFHACAAFKWYIFIIFITVCCCFHDFFWIILCRREKENYS